MTATLDKSALFAAMEAFWEAEGGNEHGVEAAISAYLQRLNLTTFNDMATRKRAELAAATARPPGGPRLMRHDGAPDPLAAIATGQNTQIWQSSLICKNANKAGGEHKRRDSMPRLAHLYFKTAIIFLIIGLTIGLHMAISQDHAATPAHAHTNLLGWVTMAIFGIYYALNPAKAERRLAMIQYYVYTSGVGVLVPSLYLMVTGRPEIEPIVAAASIVAFIGVLLFAVVIFSSGETVAQPSALRPR